MREPRQTCCLRIVRAPPGVNPRRAETRRAPRCGEANGRRTRGRLSLRRNPRRRVQARFEALERCPATGTHADVPSHAARFDAPPLQTPFVERSARKGSRCRRDGGAGVGPRPRGDGFDSRGPGGSAPLAPTPAGLGVLRTTIERRPCARLHSPRDEPAKSPAHVEGVFEGRAEALQLRRGRASPHAPARTHHGGFEPLR